MLVAGELADVFRAERARVLATTIRACRGDFEMAEEVVQEAFVAALARWPGEGVPAEPRAWLIAVARNKAFDQIRRRVRLREIVDGELEQALFATDAEPGTIVDDRVRLIYTCCHPALAREAQVALTLRTLGGLTTEEIARAFLTSTATMAQRLVRAQTKIREARIPYEVPESAELAARTDAVMAVVYLIFNEGYAATAGDAWIRKDLCGEAIRCGRLVVELTGAGEAIGLLALMLLHDARRDTRTDEHGDLVLLEDQDRSRWGRVQIAEALELVPRALSRGAGPYAVQAAIAALHASAPRASDTDWPQIVRLYDELVARAPTPVVALNRAVAIAMVDGPAAGLAAIDKSDLRDALSGYHLLHAARADLLRRLGREREAATAYRQALLHVGSVPERRFLERRLGELTR